MRLLGIGDGGSRQQIRQCGAFEIERALNFPQPPLLGLLYVVTHGQRTRVLDQAQQTNQVLAIGGVLPLALRHDDPGLDQNCPEKTRAPHLNGLLAVKGHQDLFGPPQGLRSARNLKRQVLADCLGLATKAIGSQYINGLPAELKPEPESLIASWRQCLRGGA